MLFVEEAKSMPSFCSTLWERKSQVAEAIEGATRYSAENSAREEISTAEAACQALYELRQLWGRDSSGAGQWKANISMADMADACISPCSKHATRPSASIASFIEKVD